MFIIDENFFNSSSDDSKSGRKKITKNGIIITYPTDYSIPQPICCPICEYPMREQSDTFSYEEDGCCNFCQTFFAKKFNEKWKNGWRPSKQEIDQIMMSIGATV